jgi:hypothetical protein
MLLIESPTWAEDKRVLKDLYSQDDRRLNWVDLNPFLAGFLEKKNPRQQDRLQQVHLQQARQQHIHLQHYHQQQYHQQEDHEQELMAASCKVLLAGGLSKKLLNEVTEGAQKLQRAPVLVGFLSSSDPAARVYADWTAKTAREK